MTKGKYQSLICRMENSSLTSTPFHGKVDKLNRLVAKNFPVHLAIHEIDDAKNVSHYADCHQHCVPEINMIIGSRNKLTYQIQLGSETYVVKSPASIWIPEGLEHSANVIEGSGYYVCLLLTDEYCAFKGEKWIK